jgi:hypothetical protein
MGNAWETVNLAKVNPNRELIPASEYVFELAGASMDENRPSQLNVKATIVSEGEYAGRKVFFSYPNPEEFEWSPKALKRLEIALGVDAVDGETPVAYLNRCVGARFGGPIDHVKDKTIPAGETEAQTRAKVGIFKIHPAA